MLDKKRYEWEDKYKPRNLDVLIGFGWLIGWIQTACWLIQVEAQLGNGAKSKKNNGNPPKSTGHHFVVEGSWTSHAMPRKAAVLQPCEDGLWMEQVQPDALRSWQSTTQDRARWDWRMFVVGLCWRSPNIFEYKSSWCRYYRNSTDYSLVFDDVEMCVVYPCSTPGWLYMSMRCHCFKFRLEIHHTRREIAGTDPTGEIFLVLISIHKTWDITDIPSGKLT